MQNSSLADRQQIFTKRQKLTTRKLKTNNKDRKDIERERYKSQEKGGREKRKKCWRFFLFFKDLMDGDELLRSHEQQICYKAWNTAQACAGAYDMKRRLTASWEVKDTIMEFFLIYYICIFRHVRGSNYFKICFLIFKKTVVRPWGSRAYIKEVFIYC